MRKGFGTEKPRANKKHSDKAYRNFLIQLLKASDRQSVCLVLQENLDKLNENLIEFLRFWVKENSKELPSTGIEAFGEFFFTLSEIIQDFPLGRRSDNIEIAIAGHRIALQFYTYEDFPVEWAIIQNGLGNAYKDRIRGYKSENLKRSIDCYEKALSIITYEEFPEKWATGKNNLGVVFRNSIGEQQAQDIEKAINYFLESLRVFTREEYPEEWARTQSNLGNAYSSRIVGDKLENFKKAIFCHQNALEVYTFDDNPEEWARSQNNLGRVYLDEDIHQYSEENLRKAINCLRSSLQVYTFESFPEMWAAVQTNLAGAYARLKHEDSFKQALKCYTDASQVYTYKDFPEKWAILQYNIGNLCTEMSKIYLESGFDNDLKECKEFKHDFSHLIEQAIEYFNDSLKVFTREVFPEQWASVQNRLGLCHKDCHHILKAILFFRLALTIHTPINFPKDCFRAGRNLGNTAFSLGFWEVAIEGFNSAIESVEIDRSWIEIDFRRQETLEKAVNVYEKAVQASINSYQLEQAIGFAERSRSKRLVDLIASNDLYSSNELSLEVNELLERYNNLQQQIDQERSQNHFEGNRERVGVANSRAALEAYSDAIAHLESQKQQTWEEIRKHDPVLAGQIQVTPLTFKAIQALIGQPTTAILSFYTTSDHTHIFVVQQHQITLHTCKDQGLNTVQAWILQNWLQPYVDKTDEWKSQITSVLAELAQRLQLTDLIAQHLAGIEELILVPHLFLHQVPFAALPIGNGEYLGDRFLIRYIPSCQILQFCQNRPEVKEPLTYGIVENATDDLSCTSFEADQIAQLFEIPDQQRLKGRSEATVENYRKLAQTVQVLHSSHHAQSRLDDPFHSELKLGDGAITLGQLLTPGWRLPQLSDVFLSCCETHLGATSVTDDILTLASGFLCAGARSVISTLWSVDDLATALFSIFYYQQRQQGSDRSTAMQAAQKKMRMLTGIDIKRKFQEPLSNLFLQADTHRKKIMSQYTSGSKGYLENQEYKRWAGLASQIYSVMNCGEKSPFTHPYYWAGFIVQGLR
ncbi:CHAT domain-containing protein [Kovacikia minuta CCNUW1]|uniref:CHAT domain-containing protein n=1 Tax=Kovacikia minuta TaxID=2931930 RepID=UPI001CCFB4D6|nr:CHAT domain-containing tetratricopeptide repeat protein [Kovacikia minuta]UBF27664.1 CHAT domain-containing protein [Kovacikia minuta CCNUW1]